MSGKRRDPYKVMRLLQSLARNISTEATLSALAKDMGGNDRDLDYETTAAYLSALERLMAVDNLPAWNTHIRSADTLRKSQKRHFADPSMAVGVLGLSVDKLTADLNYFGLLFESLATRDLRIYAAAKIDTDKTKAPSALTVITGNGFAYRRPDGVSVVPISTLTV